MKENIPTHIQSIQQLLLKLMHFCFRVQFLKYSNSYSKLEKLHLSNIQLFWTNETAAIFFIYYKYSDNSHLTRLFWQWGQFTLPVKWACSCTAAPWIQPHYRPIHWPFLCTACSLWQWWNHWKCYAAFHTSSAGTAKQLHCCSDEGGRN